MNFSTYRFTLDLQKHQSQVSIACFRYDSAIKLIISLTDGGNPYFIAEGCSAKLYGKKADGTPIVHNCILEGNTKDGYTKIVYDFNELTASEIGIVECKIRLYQGANEIITAPRFNIVVDERLVTESDLDLGEDAYLYKQDLESLDEIIGNEEQRKANEAQRVANEESREARLSAVENGKVDKVTTSIGFPVVYFAEGNVSSTLRLCQGNIVPTVDHKWTIVQRDGHGGIKVPTDIPDEQLEDSSVLPKRYIDNALKELEDDIDAINVFFESEDNDTTDVVDTLKEIQNFLKTGDESVTDLYNTLANKVDKQTDPYILYGTGATGQQKTWTFSEEPKKASLPLYTSRGTEYVLQTDKPVNERDCANKKYVDDGLNNKLDKRATPQYSVYGIGSAGVQATYSVGPGAVQGVLVMRPAGGQINLPDQTINVPEIDQAVSRRYVDPIFSRVDSAEKRVEQLESATLTHSLVSANGENLVPVNSGMYSYVKQVGGASVRKITSNNIIDPNKFVRSEGMCNGDIVSVNGDGSITLTVYETYADFIVPIPKSTYTKGFYKIEVVSGNGLDRVATCSDTYGMDENVLSGFKGTFDLTDYLLIGLWTDEAQYDEELGEWVGNTKTITLKVMVSYGEEEKPFDIFKESFIPIKVSKIESIEANLCDLTRAKFLNCTLQSDNSIKSNKSNNRYCSVDITYLNEILVASKGKYLTFSVTKPLDNNKYISIIIYGEFSDGAIHKEKQSATNPFATIQIPETLIKASKIELRINGSTNPEPDTTSVFSDFMLNWGDKAASYKPYSAEPIDTIEIPEAVQAIDGYGREGSYLEWDKNHNVFLTVTKDENLEELATPSKTNVTGEFAKNNELIVEGGGVIRFIDEDGNECNVPNTMYYVTHKE